MQLRQAQILWMHDPPAPDDLDTRQRVPYMFRAPATDAAARDIDDDDRETALAGVKAASRLNRALGISSSSTLLDEIVR